MFKKNTDRRYGEGLTKKQLKEFKLFINNLERVERYNYCEECHEKHGCGNEHDIDIADVGICSICGKKNDVVNCSIANKVKKDDIPLMSYWMNGERIIRD